MFVVSDDVCRNESFFPMSLLDMTVNCVTIIFTVTFVVSVTQVVVIEIAAEASVQSSVIRFFGLAAGETSLDVRIAQKTARVAIKAGAPVVITPVTVKATASVANVAGTATVAASIISNVKADTARTVAFITNIRCRVQPITWEKKGITKQQ